MPDNNPADYIGAVFAVDGNCIGRRHALWRGPAGFPGWRGWQSCLSPDDRRQEKPMTPDESLALLNLPEATTRRWQMQLHEPHRHYHTLHHIEAMLRWYDGSNPAIVAAIWLHDIVYDPKASDNEERSAAQAQADLPAGPSTDLAVRLILDTKHHAGGDPFSDAFDDLDLAIIGASPATYDRYAEQIRREYAFVPEAAYRAGRADVLREFDKRTIYRTPGFQRLEAQAHINLQREIGRLEATV
jgi:predicted metal-dependent HD superfamily phosphohydrolase